MSFLRNHDFLLSWFNVCLCFLCSSDVSYSGGNITFSLLTPEPNPRPGYNDFYNTPALQTMVHATQVRIHLSGQYHTGAAGVNQRHRYYTINEITISGRWGVTHIYTENDFIGMCISDMSWRTWNTLPRSRNMKCHTSNIAKSYIWKYRFVFI